MCNENHEPEDGSNPLLLCDGCDKACHLQCTPEGLTQVPANDWFCAECLKILEARCQVHQKSQEQEEARKTLHEYDSDVPLYEVKKRTTTRSQTQPGTKAKVTTTIQNLKLQSAPMLEREDSLNLSTHLSNLNRLLDLRKMAPYMGRNMM